MVHRPLAIFGLLVLLAPAAWWVASGARVGWWQTRVAVERADPVTGLSVLDWEQRLVPGVETPAAGLAFGGGLFVLALHFHRKKKTTRHLP